MKPAALYLQMSGQPIGPYTAPSVSAMWQAGAVNGFTLCMVEGSQQWLPLRTVVEDLNTKPGTVGDLPGIVTTQLTAKKLKVYVIISVALMLVGLPLAFIAGQPGLLVTAAGIFWYITISVIIFWKHG